MPTHTHNVLIPLVIHLPIHSLILLVSGCDIFPFILCTRRAEGAGSHALYHFVFLERRSNATGTQAL